MGGLNDVGVQGGSSSSYNMGKTSAGFGRVVLVYNGNMQNLTTGATHVGKHRKTGTGNSKDKMHFVLLSICQPKN
jgi:hypothetical protein